MMNLAAMTNLPGTLEDTFALSGERLCRTLDCVFFQRQVQDGRPLSQPRPLGSGVGVKCRQAEETVYFQCKQGGYLRLHKEAGQIIIPLLGRLPFIHPPLRSIAAICGQTRGSARPPPTACVQVCLCACMRACAFMEPRAKKPYWQTFR